MDCRHRSTSYVMRTEDARYSVITSWKRLAVTDSNPVLPRPL